MGNQTSHLSDEELLLWIDGELRWRRAAKVRVHLSACWNCRSRMAQIETTIHEFMHLHQSSIPELPPSAGPRALLKARLAELARAENEIPHHPERRVPTAWVAAASCLLVLVMTGIFLHYHTGRFKPGTNSNASSLPDPHLTPGATITVAINDLCSKPHDEVVRSVPIALQETVLREYSLPPSRKQNFEIDFLISPGLGGAENIRNLWPEPRYHTVWNSFVKDQLEDYLHQSVCEGRISLNSAQQDLAGDWISAYQKYFHTREPLSTVSELPSARSNDLVIFPKFWASAALKAPPLGRAWEIALSAPHHHRTMYAGRTASYNSFPTARCTELLFCRPGLLAASTCTGAYICSQTFNHASAVQFVEKFTGIVESNINAWRHNGRRQNS